MSPAKSQGFGQKGPRLVLHCGVKGVPAWGKGPAVTHRGCVQAAKLIMSRFHPGAWKELVIDPVLDQESSPP
jgi:hypothetical protein